MTSRPVLVAGLLGFLLGACSLFPERPPRPAVHDFGPSPPGQGAAVTVDAPEWLQDDRIRYRLLYDDPTQVRYYTLDRWVAPPALLLARRLESIDSHGMRPHVQLLEFEQVFESAARAHALAVLRVSATLPGSREVRSETVVLEQPTPTPDAAGAVSACAALAEQAVRRVGALLADWAER